jgi:hypothetical protein
VSREMLARLTDVRRHLLGWGTLQLILGLTPR